MKSVFKKLIYALLCTGAFSSSTALACDPLEDGCLGCSDDELQLCMNNLVDAICTEGGGIEFCNRRRVYEDVERQITLSTGRHFSRIRSMFRSAQKYQDPMYKH